MTLHEAIEFVLNKNGDSMTTTEIAIELNKLKRYTKKDKTPITAFQVHGRTKNYINLFQRNGSTVILKKK